MRRAGQPRVLAIGVSTGGPTALGAIIPQFPADFPLPILIVQHMPPLFTRFLAERLQSGTKLNVAGGRRWRAVGGRHGMDRPWGLPHARANARAEKPSSGWINRRPRIPAAPRWTSYSARSAEVYGGAVISAVLTGMGQDGLRGAAVLKANGAYVIAQDEATSVVWGMPGAVAGAGLANCVVPLDAVVPEILRQVGKG